MDKKKFEIDGDSCIVSISTCGCQVANFKCMAHFN